MTTAKTGLLIAGLVLGGCCLSTGALVLLGLLAGDDAPPASATLAPGGSGDPKLGGYVIWGRSTPLHEGFTESLEGDWLLMDGASVESIEEIHSDHVVTRTRRTGELWHFSFGSDGSYAFRYVITSRLGAVIWVEKGEWHAEGSTLTLTPDSCFSKSASERTDCLESAERSYALSTVQLDELTANDRPGVSFTGLRLTGPFPGYSQTTNPYQYRELQRVR